MNLPKDKPFEIYFKSHSVGKPVSAIVTYDADNFRFNMVSNSGIKENIGEKTLNMLIAEGAYKLNSEIPVAQIREIPAIAISLSKDYQSLSLVNEKLEEALDIIAHLPDELVSSCDMDAVRAIQKSIWDKMYLLQAEIKKEIKN